MTYLMNRQMYNSQDLDAEGVTPDSAETFGVWWALHELPIATLAMLIVSSGMVFIVKNFLGKSKAAWEREQCAAGTSKAFVKSSQAGALMQMP